MPVTFQGSVCFISPFEAQIPQGKVLSATPCVKVY